MVQSSDAAVPTKLPRLAATLNTPCEVHMFRQPDPTTSNERATSMRCSIHFPADGKITHTHTHSSMPANKVLPSARRAHTEAKPSLSSKQSQLGTMISYQFPSCLAGCLTTKDRRRHVLFKIPVVPAPPPQACQPRRHTTFALLTTERRAGLGEITTGEGALIHSKISSARIRRH